jgi:hypothetical protein
MAGSGEMEQCERGRQSCGEEYFNGSSELDIISNLESS